MVSTHLKKNSQIGSFPQVGVKIKHIQNHRSCRSHRVGAETTTYRKSSDTISSAIFLRSDASPSVEMVAIASPRSVFFWLRCIGWWTYLLVSWVGRSATSNKHPSKKKLPMLYSKCQRRLGDLKKKRVILNERLKLGDRSVTFCWFFKVLHPTALLDTGTYLPLEILSQVCSACAKTEKGAVGDTRSFFTKRTCRPKKNKLWIRRYISRLLQT